MKLTFFGLILSLLLSLAGTAQAATPAINSRKLAIVQTPVKSYREWKAQRIHTAGSQIGVLKAQLTSAQMMGRTAQAANLQKEISQEQWNLDVAKELSVTDYFVLYLSQVPEADRFKQAAAKMSLNEIEEMMKAYSDAVGASQNAPDTASQGSQLLPIQANQVR
jgi:hypothetical protein